jgi:hypothetical protein
VHVLVDFGGTPECDRHRCVTACVEAGSGGDVTGPGPRGDVSTFARHEFHGHSALYDRLAEFLADHAELAAPLQAAPPNQRRAILYLAAVQYLLRTAAPHGQWLEWDPAEYAYAPAM